MIKLSNVSKKYKGKELVYQDLVIHQKVIWIKGQNGSGKSTLLKAIAKIIKHQGLIEVKGSIAYLPERLAIIEGISGQSFLHLMLPSKNHHLLDYFYTLFDIHSHLENDMATYSKGTIQKIGLIYIFCLDRDINLLDEPFSGLDQLTLKRVLTYIRKSHKQYLISSHLDISQGIDYCIEL